MDRSRIVLVALFTISVFAVAASSLDSATIESGFGIEGGSDPVNNGSVSDFNTTQIGDSGDIGGGGFFDMTFNGESATGGDSSPLSSVLFLGIVVGVIAGSIALIFWATRTTAPTISPTESPSESSCVAERVAEVDESPSVDPTNEVYRAWWEMVRQLDVRHHQSRSPAELATVAVETGIDPETVAELTALFRSIRYGDVSVTDDIERQAAATRDHIQSSVAAKEGSES